MNKIQIEQKIREARPSLAMSSVKTYSAILFANYKKCFPDSKTINVDNFDKTDVFLKHLESKPGGTRKTVLSALYVISAKPEYREQMITDSDKYNEEIKKQEMTPKMEANWMSMDEVRAIVERYRSMSVYLAQEAKLRELTPKEYAAWSDYILLCLTTGIYIAPRRNLDWVKLKLKNIGEDTNGCNYIEQKGSAWTFVFNIFKTAKTFHQQKIPIPTDLRKILLPFIRYTEKRSDWLLNDSKMTGVIGTQITQRLNKIFDRKVGTSMLRHIYLTSRFAEGKTSLAELSDTAVQMGHSLQTSLEYVKKMPAAVAEESKSAEEDHIPAPVAEAPGSPKRKRGRPKKVVA